MSLTTITINWDIFLYRCDGGKDETRGIHLILFAEHFRVLFPGALGVGQEGVAAGDGGRGHRRGRARTHGGRDLRAGCHHPPQAAPQPVQIQASPTHGVAYQRNPWHVYVMVRSGHIVHSFLSFFLSLFIYELGTFL